MSHVYEMSQIPRGYAILINNLFENEGDKERLGASIDVKKLEAIFRRLNFTVEVGNNLSRNKLFEFLRKIAADPKLNSHNALIMVLMSHGKSQLFQCSDNNHVEFNEIVNIFSDTNCAYLIDKPKIIIFNCCRVPYFESKFKNFSKPHKSTYYVLTKHLC